jgi:hypothetical protein
MNTSDCKLFIEQTVNKDPIMQSEIQAHDVSSWAPNKWSRSHKKKIDSQYYDDHYSWMDDPFMQEFWWRQQGASLVGCIERLFLHKDADCYVTVVTDPTDTNVVAWVFGID